MQSCYSWPYKKYIYNSPNSTIFSGGNIQNGNTKGSVLTWAYLPHTHYTTLYVHDQLSVWCKHGVNCTTAFQKASINCTLAFSQVKSTIGGLNMHTKKCLSLYFLWMQCLGILLYNCTKIKKCRLIHALVHKQGHRQKLKIMLYNGWCNILPFDDTVCRCWKTCWGWHPTLTMLNFTASCSIFNDVINLALNSWISSAMYFVSSSSWYSSTFNER